MRCVLTANRLPGLVVRVALVDPVALGVRGDGLPLQGVDLRLLDDPQLVLPGEVVADIPIVQNSRPLMRRVLDEEGDGHGRARTGVEDLASFPPRELTRSALVTPQVVDVEVGELLSQGEAHAVGRVAVDEAAVSDEADDPGLPDAIRGPADGPKVGVVQGVLVGARGASRVGRLDLVVQGRVVLVGVVVIGGLLPHRVRRVADDHLNTLQLQLGRSPVVVGCKHALI